MRLPVAVALALLPTAGCSAVHEPLPAGPAGEWRGTTTTEGDVTRVVTESGSVWGGRARLVEEASIGVESGADEYMLGHVGGLDATESEIYLSDHGADVVRVYDPDGVYLRTLGRKGEGPGEFTTPGIVAVGHDGRAFVYDDARRVNVYAPDGQHVDTWDAERLGCCAWRMPASAEGGVWMPVRRYTAERDLVYGVEGVVDGETTVPVRWVPDLGHEGRTYPEGHRFGVGVPYDPEREWGLAFDGAIVVGVSDRYRFEIRRRDGTTLVVERYWEPVPVPPGEAEWSRRWMVGNVRTYIDPGWNGDGVVMPEHKPAYYRLLPAATGEVWVARAGPSRRVADCVEDPLETDPGTGRDSRCWRADPIVDIFGADGRYLGEVDVPLEVRLDQEEFLARGDMVIAVTEDELGTYRVKRYRLVLGREGRGGDP